MLLLTFESAPPYLHNLLQISTPFWKPRSSSSSSFLSPLHTTLPPTRLPWVSGLSAALPSSSGTHSHDICRSQTSLPTCKSQRKTHLFGLAYLTWLTSAPALFLYDILYIVQYVSHCFILLWWSESYVKLSSLKNKMKNYYYYHWHMYLKNFYGFKALIQTFKKTTSCCKDTAYFTWLTSAPAFFLSDTFSFSKNMFLTDLLHCDKTLLCSELVKGCSWTTQILLLLFILTSLILGNYF